MKLKTTTLKRGLLLYHGTTAPDFDEQSDSLTFPAWFSEKARVARYFVNWHGEPEPYPYNEKLPNSARIICYRIARPIKVLLIPDSATLTSIREEFVLDSGSDTLADWCCSQGYNGWIVPNNYPAEGGSDIMLCRGDNLEYVNTDGLNEAADDFDMKEISEPDVDVLARDIVKAGGVENVTVGYHGSQDLVLYIDGLLRHGSYPTHTTDGRKIEVAYLVHAQHIGWEIQKLPQVARVVVTSEPDPGRGHTIHFWILRGDRIKPKLREASDDSDLGDFDAKEISRPNARELTYDIVKANGVTDIVVDYPNRETMTLSGTLRPGSYPTHTPDGHEIELAYLVHAQHIGQKLRELPEVKWAVNNTRSSPAHRVNFWILWEDPAKLNEAVTEIVNRLIEANSDHLEQATRITRQMSGHGPLEVARAIRDHLGRQGCRVELVRGHALFRKGRMPHVWLKIDGQPFDPYLALRGTQPKSYEPVVKA